MTARTLVSAGACAVLVPLISAMPPSLELGRSGPWVALEAGAAHAGRPAPQTQEQTLPIRSTRVERRDAASGLKPAIDAVQRAEAGPLWFAWSVPAVAQGEKRSRWNDGDIGDCVLEDDGDIRNTHGINGGTRTLVILARSEGTAITRVAFTDERCTVDAGSRPVYWLSPRGAGRERRGARGLVRGEAAADTPGRKEKGRRHALPAVALHADPSADTALAGFAAAGQPREVRRDAAFWLGAARGTSGAAIVEKLAREDRDDDFREHLTFVLTLTGDRGLNTLVDLAKNDASAKVRGQALFWLGQKAGDRAVATLERAVVDDPDREVRKKAVFSLSQLPKDEGVPKLIALARTHRDPEVRKQAMFWLGQSGDARALQFFEEVLKN